jgi:hypothetical protein
MNAKAIHAEAAGLDDVGLHVALRFAVGVTAAFVLCEALQWTPSFLGAVFTAVFLSNLPMRPPLKMALSLVAVMAASSLFVYAISSLWHDAPLILIGVLTLIIFVAFHAMARGRAKLPALLLLICVATIPVVATIAPAQAVILPIAMIWSMVLAMLIIQIVYWLWPKTAAPGPAPAAPPTTVTPATLAALGTAIVVPLMTVYLMFGLTDALPVLVATVMLVANFDPARSRVHALGMVAGNLGGGLLGMLVHAALLTTPTLPFLALLLFLVLCWFGKRIATGGPAAAVALIACNAMLIILGSSIDSGPAALSLWLTRLLYFVLASVFAVGMMSLIWRREPPTAPDDT